MEIIVIIVAILITTVLVGVILYDVRQTNDLVSEKDKAKQDLLLKALNNNHYEAKNHPINIYQDEPIGIEVLGKVILSPDLALDFTIDYYSHKEDAPIKKNPAKRSVEEQIIYNHFVKKPAAESITIIKTSYQAITQKVTFKFISWDQFEIFDADDIPEKVTLDVSGKETLDSLKINGYDILFKHFGFRPKSFHIEMKNK